MATANITSRAACALALLLLSASTGAGAQAPAAGAAMEGATQTAAPSNGQTQIGAAQGSGGMVMDESLVIGAGDLIDVQVFGTPELSTHSRIDQQGDVLVPFSGRVHIAGLTAPAAANAIEAALRNARVMVAPHVTVFVQEYATQGVTMLGEVRAPGTYALFGMHSLYDALAAAGGVTTSAGPVITIAHRSDPDHPTEVPLNSAIYTQIERTTQIQPGDTVMVSQAPMVYVVGDVGHPGAYFLPNSQPLKILNILALASGVNPTAQDKHASIVRPTPDGGAQTIPINVHDIVRNQAPDITLQAHDILVIPRSGLKVVLQYLIPNAAEAVVSSVTTAAIVR